MPTLPRETKRPWIPQRKAWEGVRQDNYSFYNSPAWRRVSKYYRMLHPLCEECLRNGRDGIAATTTDHITPLREIQAQGGNPYSHDNLQSLCDECNASKTGRQAHRKPKND